jgi:heat shock protein HspQ
MRVLKEHVKRQDEQRIWEKQMAVWGTIFDGVGKGIEDGVKPALTACTLLSAYTRQSCYGHAEEDGHGLPYPWIDLGIDNDPAYTQTVARYKECASQARDNANVRFYHLYGDPHEWNEEQVTAWDNLYDDELKKFPDIKNLESAYDAARAQAIPKYLERIGITRNTYADDKIKYVFGERIEPKYLDSRPIPRDISREEQKDILKRSRALFEEITNDLIYTWEASKE